MSAGGVSEVTIRSMQRYGWMRPDRRYDHPERQRVRLSPARIKWLCGGRRSGKTEDSIDHVLIGHGPPDQNGMPRFRGVLTVDETIEDPTFVVAAPTYGMLRRIWWDKIKRRVPRSMVEKINETDMEVRYVNGARLLLLGMDRPTRSEGLAIDGLVFDEYAYSKPTAYTQSLRPALSTPGRRPGWAIMQGKPFGRNHFYKGWKRARDGQARNHEAFHWKSSVVMSKAEIAQARLDLDDASFRQEYEASFESWTGVVYHTFGTHNFAPVEWNPERPLAFAWDFGTSPGTVVVAQQQDMPNTHCNHCSQPRPDSVRAGDSWVCPTCAGIAWGLVPVLVVIDEAYQLVGSTTGALCRELVAKWATRVRPGSPVFLYGDPAGFSNSTRGRSTDWDEIETILGRHFRIIMAVPHAQPAQRARVNALLRLCRNDVGQVRLLVNRDAAPRTWDDFENTMLKADGSGEIDKKAAGGLYSHLTDALSYLAFAEFPIRNRQADLEVTDS